MEDEVLIELEVPRWGYAEGTCLIPPHHTLHVAHILFNESGYRSKLWLYVEVGGEWAELYHTDESTDMTFAPGTCKWTNLSDEPRYLNATVTHVHSGLGGKLFVRGHTEPVVTTEEIEGFYFEL